MSVEIVEKHEFCLTFLNGIKTKIIDRKTSNWDYLSHFPTIEQEPKGPTEYIIANFKCKVYI